MEIGSKLRSEKKNSFESFTVLFAGGKAYIGAKAYPLGELTAELLNFPDEQLFALRHLADRMLAFERDSFYDHETKDLALAQAMQDKINKVLAFIYAMPLFDRMTLDRDIDFRILPIAFETNRNGFIKTATPGTKESERFDAYLYKLATLADEDIYKSM